jgi:hypothetical protein
MTYAEREEMFAKECWSIKDVMQLFGMPYATASEYIRKIKTRLTIGLGKTLRLEMDGKLHVQDYLDFVGMPSNRYDLNKVEEVNVETNATD